MAYQTNSTNTLSLAISTGYRSHKEATDYLTKTIPETKRWIEEGVLYLEPDELNAYLKFVITLAVAEGKATTETLEELVCFSKCNNEF